jgi:aryl-alcohol dehydrogenase-like predicted oxidoreductase
MKEALKYVDIVSNQVPYSMLVRDIEKEIVPLALQNNMAIIAYSPLQRGLLTGKIKPGQTYNTGDTRKGNPFYTDENVNRINQFLDKLKPLANEKKATLGQLVIKWTIEQPGITIALVGARNPEQALETPQLLTYLSHSRNLTLLIRSLVICI